MGSYLRRIGVGGTRSAWSGVAGVVLATVGCASPGPPRAPSLNLPAPVTDLAAHRVGGQVTLQFTAPSRTTDKIGIRGGRVTGEFCREEEHQTCVAVPSSKAAVATMDAQGGRNAVMWTDTLPTALASGAPRLLGYRVEFFSASGRTAGWSEMAVTAAGAAPERVEDLRVEGSRLGVVVSWKAAQASGEVLIQRKSLEQRAVGAAPRTAEGRGPETIGSRASKAGSAPEVWMGTQQGQSQPDRVLDTTAAPDTPYAYSALRRVVVALGGRKIEMRSEPTAPVDFMLREVYPPATPTGLTAAGYFEDASAKEGVPTKFAVDLIWNPVDEAGTVVPLAGYNVYRQEMQGAGDVQGRGAKQNTAPVTMPSFHDASAQAAARYRYSVTAVDAKGNESGAASVVEGPNTQ